MHTKVLPSKLVDPAIENLFFRATGKIPFLVCQRDFWQLVIWHGPIGSNPFCQFNLIFSELWPYGPKLLSLFPRHKLPIVAEEHIGVSVAQFMCCPIW